MQLSCNPCRQIIFFSFLAIVVVPPPLPPFFYVKRRLLYFLTYILRLKPSLITTDYMKVAKLPPPLYRREILFKTFKSPQKHPKTPNSFHQINPKFFLGNLAVFGDLEAILKIKQKFLFGIINNIHLSLTMQKDILESLL